MKKENVTLIGLGLMGSALARALVKADLKVTVWNRSFAKAKSFENGTVQIAKTIAEAVQASDIIVVCIRDYEAADALFRTEIMEKQLTDKVFVQLSTGTPAKAREANEWAKAIGATYLDGEIMTFPDAIGTDKSAILYSGDKDSFEACKTVLGAFGGTAQLIGSDPGMAAALSNAVLSIYFGLVYGVVNGAAICDAENVPLPLFRQMGISLLPLFGDVISRSTQMISTDNYESEHSTLQTSAGALAQVAAVGKDAGLDSRFIDCMQSYAAEAIEAGYGSVNNAVLFKQFLKK